MSNQEEMETGKTTKRAVIAAVCVLALLAAFGGGIVFGMKGTSRKVPRGEERPVQEVESPKKQEHVEAPQKQEKDAQIGLDTAKNMALSDAGLSSDEVTYTKEKLDYEDGVSVYEITFYTTEHEYEYEINSTTGAISSKEVKAWKTGGVQAQNPEGTENHIGVEQAKSLALEHAGFSAGDVTFTKAEFEIDDGEAVYEIEFYKDGREYEFTVNAKTGSIMEYDVD